MTVSAWQIALAVFLLLFGISLIIAGLPKVILAVLAFVAAALLLAGK